MLTHRFIQPFALTAMMLCVSHTACAGGVSLGGTRLIYPAGSSQVSMSVNNSDDNAVFLIQSWVENENGARSPDFAITPPLFVIQPQKENTLRVMYISAKNLPADRETVYWLNMKAIPSAAADTKGKNTLQLAVLSRIKLFVRPKNLPIKSVDAPALLRFHRVGAQLSIKNPSPYYVTLVQFTVGGEKLPNTMVPPKESLTVPVPDNAQGEIVFQTVSDFGANTAGQKGIME